MPAIFFDEGPRNFIDTIDAKTTRQQLDEHMEKDPNFSINTTINYLGQTVFALAAKAGNLDLMDYSYTLGGDALLSIADKEGLFPLHLVCKASDWKYPTAKKMVQLGAPINQRLRYKDSNGDFHDNKAGFLGATPLEFALESGQVKIAAMLLRLGGIAREGISQKYYDTLEAAKMKIMDDNEKLFKMGMSGEELPDDVLNRILFMSSRTL